MIPFWFVTITHKEEEANMIIEFVEYTIESCTVHMPLMKNNKSIAPYSPLIRYVDKDHIPGPVEKNDTLEPKIRRTK